MVKLRKQGSSLILTIPKELVDELKWKENDDIILESELQKTETYFRGQKILKAGKID
jgi:antitoxin component of MazEF toxin-antitoxin module